MFTFCRRYLHFLLKPKSLNSCGNLIDKIRHVAQWLKTVKMSIDAEKTKIMIFRP